MDKLADLRQRRGLILDQMEKIIATAEAANDGAGRDLTEAERKEYDDAKAAADALQARIDRALELQAAKAATAQPIAPLGGQGAGQRTAIAPRIYGRPKYFKGERAVEDAYRAGQWALASLFGNAKAAEWCRENGVAVTKAQSEGVNTAGGYLVPEEFNSAIIDLRETYGVARQAIDFTPMASDTGIYPRRTSGLTAYFVGENAAITESEKAWDQVRLTAKKLAALARMSTEIDQDAVINIADDLAREMAYAFAEKEDDCLFNGDGTSTYGGIQGIVHKFNNNTYAGKVDAATGHDTFAEVDAADLTNLMAKLPQYALPGAAFYCSQPAWATVFQRLVAAGGGNTIDSLTGQVRPAYLGYPVRISQKMPTSTSTINDTVMILFGDLRLAAFGGERRGFTVKTSDQRYFEYDQIGIQATERIDINVHSLGDSTNPGPVVALWGNT